MSDTKEEPIDTLVEIFCCQQQDQEPKVASKKKLTV
jgi:hypothetical protein